MLRRVAEQILVPELLALSEAQLFDRMPSRMPDPDRGVEPNRPSSGKEALAEIDVLEPRREEAFVKPLQVVPVISANQKERACGLLHELRLVQIEIQATIAPVDGIIGKEAMEARDLHRQSDGGRQSAHGKADLRFPAGLIHQQSRSRDASLLQDLVRKNVDWVQDLGIGVQQQQQRCGGEPDALVDPARETSIGRIPNNGDRFQLRNFFERPVGGSVVDHDNGESMANARPDGRRQVTGGVMSDNNCSRKGRRQSD